MKKKVGWDGGREGEKKYMKIPKENLIEIMNLRINFQQNNKPKHKARAESYYCPNKSSHFNLIGNTWQDYGDCLYLI